MKTLVYFEYNDETTRIDIHEEFLTEMRKIGFNNYDRTNLLFNEGGLSKIMTLNKVYEKYKKYFKYFTISRTQDCDITDLNK